MQLYRVVGTVTLNRSHPSVQGGTFKLSEPAGESLLGFPLVEPDAVVVWDDLGASEGTLIAVSDGAEAAQPFRPALKPVDAYNSAIIESLHLNPKLLQDLEPKAS
jgi:ethanolamine utilization protein EutN